MPGSYFGFRCRVPADGCGLKLLCSSARSGHGASALRRATGATSGGPWRISAGTLFMASMRDVPHVAWNVMAICSWHFPSRFKASFTRQKEVSKPLFEAFFPVLSFYFIWLTRFDPDMGRSGQIPPLYGAFPIFAKSGTA